MQESLVAGTTRVMFGFTEFAHNIGVEPIPDLTGWQAYCDDCRMFREVRRAQEWDVSTQEEYFDFVGNNCHNIVMSLRRANPAERLVFESRPDAPAEN